MYNEMQLKCKLDKISTLQKLNLIFVLLFSVLDSLIVCHVVPTMFFTLQKWNAVKSLKFSTCEKFM